METERNANMEKSGMMIKAINKSAVHKICAGQVIVDLSSAVKEVVENSLDAGATAIEISLKDYGQHSFHVSDNGSGISPHNFKVLALKHHTSKLSDFPDLQSLATFGFRGEALSSLCALGDLTVETRTINESVATHLTYDRTGVVVAEKKTARQIGTTVTVKNLFSNLPVRSREFSRNIRKEYGKLITLLNAYAVIAKGVRIVCSNTTGKNVKSVVLKTQGSSSLKDNIITVLGMSTFSCLEHFTICISDTCKVEGFLSKPGQGSGRNLGDRQYFFVNGRPVDIPKVGKLVNEMYRGANSRQYPITIMNFTIPANLCDVNVTPDKRKIFFSDEVSIMQSLREGLSKIYSPNNASYSVHKVEQPAKEANSRKVCSVGEESSKLLEKCFPDNNDSKELHDKEDTAGTNSPSRLKQFDIMSSRELKKSVNNNNQILLGKDYSFRVQNFKKEDNSVRSCIEPPTDNVSSAPGKTTLPSLRLGEEKSAEAVDPNNHSNTVQSSLKNFITVHKRKREGIIDSLTELPVLRSETPDSRVKKISTHIFDEMTRYSVNNKQAAIMDEDNVNKNPSCLIAHDNLNKTAYSPQTCKSVDGAAQEKFKDEEKAVSSLALSASPIKDAEDEKEYPLRTSTRSEAFECDARKPSSSSNLCFTVQFKIEDLKTRRQKRLLRMKFFGETCNRMSVKRSYAAATLELSQPENEERKARALAAATTELERLFRKEDFSRMKVIGQFNLGFIIGKLDQDLFILDQHAADEKYNFERLSQSTILNLQPLLQPLRLELSPEEEVVASLNMDIIRKNGFAVGEDLDAPPGQRYKLKAVPFSKNITFGVEDVKELISTLSDSQGDCSVLGSYRMDTTDSVCPSRVRAMFASRACRSSIMIGDPLGKSEMQKIIEHLVGLRSPWNCPHGRPTMRHLVDLTAIYKRYEENDQDI